MPHTVDQAAPDTGIACLSHIARLHGIPVDAGQLRHQYGPRGKPLDSIDLLRAAKGLGLKAAALDSDWSRLARIQFPAIARHRDGHYFVLAGASNDKVLVQDPLEKRAITLPLIPFEASWSGQHFPVFAAQLAEQGIALPGYVQREFEDYLKCGRQEHGGQVLGIRLPRDCHASDQESGLDEKDGPDRGGHPHPAVWFRTQSE